jgi:endonuclease/exonuclease/phosphatase family metal-dependent hydrolase
MQSRRVRAAAILVGVALPLLGVASACVSNPPVTIAPIASCASRDDGWIRWIRIAPHREDAAIDLACSRVEPPFRVAGQHGGDVFTGSVAVVSWNTHIGGGDIEMLVRDLRSGRLTGGAAVSSFVLLLQETYRGPGRDIVTTTSALNLPAVYIPSMHNGREPKGDRGNAIVSTLPLSDVTAIELPLERQRRVAIAATINLSSIQVRVFDVHLSNAVAHHLWVAAELGRLRQARALARAIPEGGPVVLGGDLNSWFGVHDAAYRELTRVLPASDRRQTAPTFGPLRLDHLLLRLPREWTATVRRAPNRYGSDHYPLVAMIDTMRRE